MPVSDSHIAQKTISQNDPDSYKESTLLTPPSNSTTTKQPIIEPTCVDDKTTVDYSMFHDGSDGKLDIIKTYTDSRESAGFTIEGVAERVNDPVEIQRCYIYVIKPLSDTQWQLWRYTFVNKGEMLYSGNRFQFRVNKPETLIALNTYTDEKEHVLILDVASKQPVLRMSIDEVKAKLQGKIGADVLGVAANQLRGWNTNGDTLWGNISAGAFVEAFWKLDTRSGEISVLSDFPLKFPNGVALNPDKELVAYSEKPMFFDEAGSDAWEKEHATYSLFVYLFTRKTSIVITRLPSYWPGGMNSPMMGWDSPTELRYSTPNGRAVYAYTE